MEQKVYGVNKIPFIEIKNSLGLKVIFTPAGAAIREIYFDDQKITDNAEDDNSYLDIKIKYGKTHSRYFENNEVEIDGTKYQLDKKMTLNNYLYTSKPIFDKKYFLVQYTFKKKHMKDGLPGTVIYFVTYVIKDDSNEIAIDYRALSNKKTALDMSQILKFNFGGATKLLNEKEIEGPGYKVRVEGDQHFEKNEIGEVKSLPNDNICPPSIIFKKKVSYYIEKR